MPPLDEDLVSPLSLALRAAGIDLVLGEGLAGIEPVPGAEKGDSLTVTTAAGRSLPAGLVLLTIGVKPESGIAREAGIDLGVRGVRSAAAAPLFLPSSSHAPPNLNRRRWRLMIRCRRLTRMCGRWATSCSPRPW